jgi:hypothetical protein
VDEDAPWWKKMGAVGFNAIVGGVLTQPAQRLGELFDVLGEKRLSSYEVGSDVSDKEVKPVDRLGAGINLGASGAGAYFSVVAAESQAAEEIPIIGKPVFGTVNKGFALLDEASRWVGGKLVEALPVDRESKDVLMEPVQNLAGIVGSLSGVKAVHSVAKTGGGKAVERLPVSEKTQGAIKTVAAKTAQYGMSPFSSAFGDIMGGITSRVKVVTDLGEKVTKEVAQNIVNEVVKEVPIPKDRNAVEFSTPGGKVKMETDQFTVLQNLIPGKENITYKVVPSLGKDPAGKPVESRFEFDHKTKEATVLVTSPKVASDLLHTFSHPVDAQLGSALSKKLGDIVPDFHQNQGQITQMLADYALIKLGGNADRIKLDTEILKIADNLRGELKVAAASESKSAMAKQFTEAFGETLTKSEVLKQSPELAQLSEHLTRGTDIHGEKGSPQEKGSILAALKKAKGEMMEAKKDSPEFQAKQQYELAKAMGVEERAAKISQNSDWREVMRAIKNSPEFKKEGSLSDALINGTIMELNGRQVLVPQDRIKEYQKRGYVVKTTMDGIAHGEGFESAEQYAEYITELDVDAREINRSPLAKQLHEDLMETDQNYVNLTRQLDALTRELTGEETALSGANEKAKSDESGVPEGTPGTQGTIPGVESPTKKAIKEKASRVYERMQAENPSELTENVSYEARNMKADAERAVELVGSDPQMAYEVAMGVQKLSDVTSTAVNIAMADMALESGNNALFAQLTKSRSLALTRAGQEIVAEKASISDNSPSRYVKELIRDRLAIVGHAHLKGIKERAKSSKSSDTRNAVEHIDAQVKEGQKVVKAAKKKRFGFEDAQKLIDSLACS